MTTTADNEWQLLTALTATQEEQEQGLRETESLLKEQSQETDRQIREVKNKLNL